MGKRNGGDGKNQIMIFGPKNDGTTSSNSRRTAGEALTISVPEPS
jgi:hypothetical protein